MNVRSYLRMCGVVLVLLTCASASAVEPRDIEDVVIVYKTHIDVGYTDTAKNVVHQYRTEFIDRALDVLENNRSLPCHQQFVWTVPGWMLERMVEDWDGQTADRKAKILEALRSGQLVPHALPFTTHTEFMEEEALVRGLEPSVRVSRLADQDLPTAGKFSDVPSHSWIIPTVLSHAGIKFLHLGCNNASANPQVPDLFWWEGPDGSRVLTVYSPRGYTHRWFPKGWPTKTYLSLIMTGDNHGPPKPETVAEDIAKNKQLFRNARIQIGTMDEFAELLLQEDLSDLPVIRGDMPDTWIHGVMSAPRSTRAFRRCGPRIPTAESLAVMMHAWGLPTAEDRAAAIYNDALRYGEHTWGHNGTRAWKQYGQTFREKKAQDAYQWTEGTWDEKSAHAYAVESQTDDWIAANLTNLAQAVDHEGARIVVYNALAFVRDGVVEVKGEIPDGSVLRNLSTGHVSPTEATSDGFRFLSKSVPAGGYTTYAWEPGKAGESESLVVNHEKNAIENDFYRVVLDPKRGAVASIIDKRSGRELVDASTEYGFGQYLHERFSYNEVRSYNQSYGKGHWATKFHGGLDKGGLPGPDIEPYRATLFNRVAVSYTRTDLSVSAILRSTDKGEPGHEVAVEVTLFSDQPYLEVTWSIKDKPPLNHPEAGWLCLPLKAAAPVFRLGRLGAIIDIATETVLGSNRDVWCLENAIAVTDDEAATCVLPLDSPLVSLERPGIWKYSPDFIPKTPTVFVNLFNNQWNTNFRLWSEGSWSSAVRIWNTDRYDDGPGLFVPSLEGRVPLEAAMVDAPAGKLPVSTQGLRVSHPNVRLSALARNPLGDGILLRFWEQGGTDTRFTVTFPRELGVSSLQPCDLRGVPQGDPIRVTNNEVGLTIGRFSPLSYRISPEE